MYCLVCANQVFVQKTNMWYVEVPQTLVKVPQTLVELPQTLFTAPGGSVQHTIRQYVALFGAQIGLFMK